MMRKCYVAALGLVVLLFGLSACDQEFNDLDGGGVTGGQNFQIKDTVFDVFAFNKRLPSVRTNNLPTYQLGNYTDPIFGRSSAAIAVQLNRPPEFNLDFTRRFGDKNQEQEDIDAAFLAANPNVDTVLVGDEQERLLKVYLELPFYTDTDDRDNDGVPDSLDADPLDAQSDSDMDGLTDAEEAITGTNPLVADTDGDGLLDSEDNCNGREVALIPRQFSLDSIYGNRLQQFNLSVNRFNYYLRDLDPSTNFEESQEYSSAALEDIFQGFIGTQYFNEGVTINDFEILRTEVIDDNETRSCEDTEGQDPPSIITVVSERLSPRIRVELPVEDFQSEILDLEDADFFRNDADFTEHFRGLFISLDATELLMFIDMQQARVVLEYEYEGIDDNGTITDSSDDEEATLIGRTAFPLTGNTVNTFTTDFPSSLGVGQNTNADRLYLKGGAGSFAELRLLDETGDAIEQELSGNQWLINEASLVFNVDEAALNAAGTSFINAYRLYVYNIQTGEPLVDQILDPTAGPLPEEDKAIHGGFLVEEDGSAKYKVRITQHLNRILRDTFSNVKLGVAVTPDINLIGNFSAMVADDTESTSSSIPVAHIINPFGTVIYGSTPAVPEDKKLQLEIIYSDPNQE